MKSNDWYFPILSERMRGAFNGALLDGQVVIKHGRRWVGPGDEAYDFLGSTLLERDRSLLMRVYTQTRERLGATRHCLPIKFYLKDGETNQ